MTLGTILVMSGARMLMYGPACPCMCLQQSVHSCSAGRFFWNYIPMIAILGVTHSHNHPLKVSYQLQLCNCQFTLCVHPSKHTSLSLCVRVCVCEMCMYIILCVVHSQR